ncbi:hypothetical protein, partial [Streptococcus pneumoniae]|uniref:hypothetical protein n=1 Tax=Streptococcus pneumoniae TaxID=1313 RepID=UPI001E3FA24C
ILKKAAADKIKALEVELQSLRKRELAKAVIPPHKHNTGLSVSAGVEDVPPGKINPKGKDDPFKGKGAVEKEEISPEETSEGS